MYPLILCEFVANPWNPRNTIWEPPLYLIRLSVLNILSALNVELQKVTTLHFKISGVAAE
jgi:hypothetical protein